jgi:hypothetical protein
LDDNERQTVGAPSELAEAEEVPPWFENIVKLLFTGPILISFLCGGIPTALAICWCVSQLFL